MAKKINGLTKTVDNLKKMAPQSSINAETVARGAAGVAVIAGVVAAGAALSNAETREKLGKGAQSVAQKITEVASNLQEEAQKKYNAAHHDLSISKKSQDKKA